MKKAQKKALTDEVQCFSIIWFTELSGLLHYLAYCIIWLTALSGLLCDDVISSLAA
ncbi:hypothetical protein HP572_13975 [Pectobacterium sp. PL64]|uniref:hypothetical protein n=1 Tax=Pectobacterium sp. PL64 TaxID=2738983 RepID=UPI001F0BAD39|nr:hypothetical protein [Pectobacterium sp. PL64]UMO86493.1 hypothetical protein HP572_13975 [Pectobacterium sp. PL64]